MLKSALRERANNNEKVIPNRAADGELYDELSGID